MLAGQQRQPRDSVLVNPHQSGGLTDAAPLGKVLEDRQDLVVRELGVKQRGALELGKPGLAGVAIQQTVLRLAEAAADREVTGVALAVAMTIGVLAAEVAEVVRGNDTSLTNPWR